CRWKAGVVLENGSSLGRVLVDVRDRLLERLDIPVDRIGIRAGPVTVGDPEVGGERKADGGERVAQGDVAVGDKLTGERLQRLDGVDLAGL
ncbi:MAG TPA: hypothetical protein VGR26_13400, partial [Acidimicrobiales bacterium]|nr:hypothetical protein [Acidimicrobiales bacterium]